MLVLIISCYFFAFPIGILITLSDAFNNLGIYYGSIVLIIIGCIPIIGLIIYYFIVIMIYLIKLP